MVFFGLLEMLVHVRKMRARVRFFLLLVVCKGNFVVRSKSRKLLLLILLSIFCVFLCVGSSQKQQQREKPFPLPLILSIIFCRLYFAWQFLYTVEDISQRSQIFEQKINDLVGKTCERGR